MKSQTVFSIALAWLGWLAPGGARAVTLDVASGNQDVTVLGARGGDHAYPGPSGDVNHDGSPDLIIGEGLADGPTRVDCGRVDVFFGPRATPLTLDLLAAGGDVTIFGAEAGDSLGPGAIGDLDGDGIADLVLASPYAQAVPTGSGPHQGAVYILYGPLSAGTIDLATAPASRFGGIDNGDYFGAAVAVGDVTGDNRDDLVVAAYNAGGPLNARSNSGEVYVLRGPIARGTRTNLSVGSAYATIYGADQSDGLGYRLAVSDLVGTGSSDLLIEAVGADGAGNARVDAGEIEVLAGPIAAGITDLRTTAPSLLVIGPSADGFLGAMAVGDLTGSSASDLVIGVAGGDGPLGARMNCGTVYVLPGPFAAPPATVDLASATGLLTIHGAEPLDGLGTEVFVSEISGRTGAKDLLMGAPGGDGPLNERNLAGEAYALYGPLPSTGTIDLATAVPDIHIYGAEASNQLGTLLSASDISGDGIADIVAGSQNADGPSGARPGCGEVYVFYYHETNCALGDPCPPGTSCECPNPPPGEPLSCNCMPR